ncbi:hypothetical protein C0583_03690 [Candidatus Parcubacteria bacterium]|nr:MAG: hypothetical protein C0583_03690 [Candidatus Parcubacteria bacterium]
MEGSPTRPSRARLGRGGHLFMYYVYILYSKKLDCLYKGSCSDIKERFKRHNSRRSKTTSRGIPWKLVHLQIFVNKKDALAEERFLKTGKGRERIKYLLKNYFKNKDNGRFA